MLYVCVSLPLDTCASASVVCGVCVGMALTDRYATTIIIKQQKKKSAELKS